jgi:hypothetical protein
MAQRPETAFRALRVIVTALAGGVGAMWVAGWVVTDGGSRPLAAEAFSPVLALVVWAVCALPAFGGALVFRGRAASTAGGRGRPATGAAPGPDFQRIQTSTIVAHALLEGPALLGAVLFLLTGATTLAWVALPVYGLGAALTWPQRDWFGAQGG